MAGDPTAFLMGAGGGGVYGSMDSGPSRAAAGTTSSHWGFVFWLAIIGVVIPVAILGGLQVGGFSFVFRHR